jgi:hypothetical protein
MLVSFVISISRSTTLLFLNLIWSSHI